MLAHEGIEFVFVFRIKRSPSHGAIHLVGVNVFIYLPPRCVDHVSVRRSSNMGSFTPLRGVLSRGVVPVQSSFPFL